MSDMYDDLRMRAKKRVEAKMAFYICAVVFAGVTALLMLLSFYLPSVAFWLRLPIPIFIMVLGILYMFAFGVPGTGPLSKEWQEEEIEREMMRLYRRKRGQLPPAEELSEEEMLELKELEEIRTRWESPEDYV